MSIIVQKFGGTSLADIDKIKNVANAVVREKKLGNDVIVVVSAMGHTTDNLIKLAHKISDHPSEREMDMLMSTGEQISIALLTMAIHELGYSAVSMTGAQVGILTEETFSKARIVDIKTDKLSEHIKNGEIVIVAGFQGVTKQGEITTLGRGGSDTSAVAIAAKLQVERCDIYSDVEGIYTTDPRVVPTAKKLKKISYEEMLELARVGANVLHPRSVETAKQFQVPMRLRSSFNLDDLGTLVIGVENMEIYKPVTGLACDKSQVRVVICDVPDRPGNASKLFSLLAKYELSVDMIIQSYARHVSNTNDIAFTIDKDDLAKFVSVENEISSILNPSNIHIDEDIAKVSIVGAGMIDRPGIAAQMFETLAKEGINIKMISTSEIKISCLVEKMHAKQATEALCRCFELDGSNVALVHGTLPD
ncbi:MAG: aspartate kinase [Candidatus Gastranaerophilales bacterium]|nr:aspartate kinase [Candidatus Gastranaerophilales bacterium]